MQEAVKVYAEFYNEIWDCLSRSYKRLKRY